MGRLAAGRRVARRLRPDQDRAPAAARPPCSSAAAPLRRARRRSTAARRTSPGCTRRAARWRRRTGSTTSLHVVGMFVSGDPLRSPGPHGEQQRDSSFMIWLNSDDEAVEITLPENDWVQSGRGGPLRRTHRHPARTHADLRRSAPPCRLARRRAGKFGARHRRVVAAPDLAAKAQRGHDPSSAVEVSRPLRGTTRTV